MLDNKTAESTSNQAAGNEGFSSAPSISLPKSGGAIRGIGEKFGANPVTGTGSMTVPIYTSPGRSGFGPQLSLSYDSGSGNGPFGLGWCLGLPQITRKTDKGLPQYQDAEESDVFVISGAEDLVPLLIKAGDTWVREKLPFREMDGVEYRIQRYRPRIEGLFARIERWTNVADATDSFWRSISKDNITTWYGKTPESRVTDPSGRTRIFSWLICQSYDDKGNGMVYDYVAEDSANVDLAQAHERNRSDGDRATNRYLKRIRYGNTQSRSVQPDLSQLAWLFELVFDYGEGHYQDLAPDAQGREFVQASPVSSQPRLVRQDPFSSYRSSFEVRTYRLCRRVLMFHHFPEELGVQDYLVRATEFTYHETPVASFIASVTNSGYRLQQNGVYLKKSLPSLDFEYSEATVQEAVREVDPDSLANLPASVDGGRYQWLDLDGEGLQCVLAEQDDGWYYKRNLSPLTFTFDAGNPVASARFEALTEIATLPSFAQTTMPHHQFLDLTGDGKLDCVVLEQPVAGFFERTEDQNWDSFATLPSLPEIDWSEPNLRFLDVDGDGHADILITEHEALTWHPSLAAGGFGPAIRIPKPKNEEEGPAVIFGDAEQAIFLADMSGDGLTDIVRIRNGEVCYWPNLGYGRFGKKIAMDQAPWFETQDLFDQRRIRLGDIDGSGVTDLIYLAHDGVRLYFNQSGNRWSEPRTLSAFPRADDFTSVQVLDLLGNGTACLVWMSSLPGDAGHSMRYIDLMGGEKPHLLIRSRNNLGAETRVLYAPSTKFYLADRAAGQPWVTRLPFPVHVVGRAETYDWVSRNRFVTRYAYHHGFYDGIEREFRGFGRVEQFDTEELGALSDSGVFPDAGNIDAASYVSTVLTRTWFHTGAYLEEARVSRHLEDEYWRESDLSEGIVGLTDAEFEVMLLPDTVLPIGLAGDEVREAYRSLKGALLRQEVYALDGTEEADRPYVVSERNYTIKPLQPFGPNRHAVFFTHPREAIEYHYERKLYDVNGRRRADPRVTHNMVLAIDDFGNVLRTVAVGYRRRALPDADAPEQEATHLTLTVSSFANRPDEADWYRVGLPVETHSFEIVKAPEPTITDTRIDLFRFAELTALTEGLFPPSTTVPEVGKTWPYERWDWRTNPVNAPGDTRLRLIEQVRAVYRKNDLSGPLAVGQIESMALPYEGYKLAFTPGLLTQVYRRSQENLLPNPVDVLSGQGDDRGGYVDLDGDGHWWIPSGRVFYSPDPTATAQPELPFARDHFFLPHRYRDPFHTDLARTETFVGYDSHDLLMQTSRDAVSNTVTAEHDYRMLQPKEMTDPNGNRSAVAFDTLGMVAGTALMGKPLPAPVEGDTLDGFSTDLTQAQIDGFYQDDDPHVPASSLLQNATTRITYDLDRFRRALQAHPDDPTQWLPVYAATVARETHASDPLPPDGLKIQISFSYSDGFGREIQKKIQAEPGPLVERGPVVSPRWIGSGWTIFNNKGKPVRQYEPFFSQLAEKRHQFEFGVRVGVSPILFYDPVERTIATLHPNHIYEKVIFDPWQQTAYDVNDTVTLDPGSDLDVKGFFFNPDGTPRLPTDDYLPTWYGLRTDPANAAEASQIWPDPKIRNAEKDGAEKAAIHANTPLVAHFDTLGRTFLTVAHNKFKRSGTPPADPPAEEFYHTRVIFDIEGNQREVRDAIEQAGDPPGRVVMRYDYDMLGNRIHQASMEAGERWMLNDVTGKPIRAWDSRGFMKRITYDELRRPTGTFVTENGAERLDMRTVYGETQGAASNHRMRVFQLFDGAGVVTSEAYDFKGNLLRGRRELLPNYKRAVDWQQNPVANEGTFKSSTTYDALNRPTAITAPDHSVSRPNYNEANLLDKMELNLPGSATPTPFVTNINYDAKGQRELIVYGNGVQTSYEYDRLTFRLTGLRTTRPVSQNGLASQLFSDPAVVQDLHYTYDPAGNITRIEDAALQTIFHNNEQVQPVCAYTYDAIYRLIEARGREHIGQTAPDFDPPAGNRRDFPFAGLHAHPNDLQAMRNYTEGYEYEAVGNFQFVRHSANAGGWTRSYEYDAASLIEPAKKSNRLTRTTIGNGANFIETCGYTDAQGNDVDGCITAINDMKMVWDSKDQLQQVDLGGGGTAYYVYDGSGQRVRKVIENQNGMRKQERIYLAGFEIYREYDGSGATVTLVRETLHVMGDKQRIALVETRTERNEPGALSQLIRYQFANHLGSAGLELDDQAQIISYEEYTPYGSTSYQAVRSQTEISKRYRYTGKERDEETGFAYHGARYYAPWLGRWASCDPISLKGGLNSYSYCFGNCLRLSDPAGTQPDDKHPSCPPLPTPPAPALNDPQAGRDDYLAAEVGAWDAAGGGDLTKFEENISQARQGDRDQDVPGDPQGKYVSTGDTFNTVGKVLTADQLRSAHAIQYCDEAGAKYGWVTSEGSADILWSREGVLLTAWNTHATYSTEPGFVASLLNPVDLVSGALAGKLFRRGATAVVGGVVDALITKAEPEAALAVRQASVVGAAEAKAAAAEVARRAANAQALGATIKAASEAKYGIPKDYVAMYRFSEEQFQSSFRALETYLVRTERGLLIVGESRMQVILAKEVPAAVLRHVKLVAGRAYELMGHGELPDDVAAHLDVLITSLRW